jgi:hypothetical protein
MKELNQLKEMLLLDRKTLPIKDIAPLVLEIEKMYLQTADKLSRKRSRENELSSQLATSRKLAAALAMKVGFEHISEEDKRRLKKKVRR